MIAPGNRPLQLPEVTGFYRHRVAAEAAGNGSGPRSSLLAEPAPDRGIKMSQIALSFELIDSEERNFLGRGR
jgi:hypothetical protein